VERRVGISILNAMDDTALRVGATLSSVEIIKICLDNGMSVDLTNAVILLHYIFELYMVILKQRKLFSKEVHI
jgi:hypothetical protein